MRFAYRCVAFAAAGVLAGCGLIDPDVTDFDLTLPEKKFTIDARGWEVSQSDADMVLGQTCQSSSQCNAAAKAVCPENCSATCNAEATCDLNLDVSLAQPVDLTMESSVRTISDQSVIEVSIDSVTYAIANNTLNVDTPELSLYISPSSVVAASDASAKKIGTIDPIAAGETTTSPRAVKFTAAGRAELQKIMGTFKTPFNILVGTSLVVTQGQQVPTGQLDAIVYVRGHAGL